MRDFSRLITEPFYEPQTWRREALEVIAADMPGIFRYKPGGIVTCVGADQFRIDGQYNSDWGALLECLLWLCQRCDIPWRLQTNDDEHGEYAHRQMKCKARTRGRWYYGETPAEALLYAVASSRLLLTPGVRALETGL